MTPTEQFFCDPYRTALLWPYDPTEQHFYKNIIFFILNKNILCLLSIFQYFAKLRFWTVIIQSPYGWNGKNQPSRIHIHIWRWRTNTSDRHARKLNWKKAPIAYVCLSQEKGIIDVLCGVLRLRELWRNKHIGTASQANFVTSHDFVHCPHFSFVE